MSEKDIALYEDNQGGAQEGSAVDYLTTNIDLKKVANAIRSRTGKTATISYPDGYVSEISKLSDTSDATVTAGDMAYGVVAYGKNGKVYGTIDPIDSTGEKAWSDSTVAFHGGLEEIQLAKRIPFPGTLFRNGSTVVLRASPSEFGNATAADVAAGKTFTSVAGLKVVGTAESSSGSSFEGASLAAYDELVYGVGFALNARNSYIVSIPDGEVVAIIEKRAFTYLDTAYSNVLNDNLKITGSTNGNLLYSEGTATSENRNLSITSFEF